MSTSTVSPSQEQRPEDPERYRPWLFSIAYRMVKSAAEAEDIVQEGYLRYHTAASEEVRFPRYFLGTIVRRLCLDHLKSARVRREEALDPGVDTPADPLQAPSRSTEQRQLSASAFQVLLECLTPQERAAFVLHEVFEYGYDEIARLLCTSQGNCRQLVHRASERLLERQVRFQLEAEAQRRLTERFIDACQRGDLKSLATALARDSRLANLPQQPHLFVGRDRELSTAAALLCRPDLRLLTLTGPPGIGKSRLATRVAAELIDHFEDGVFFISLANLEDPALVVGAIAQAVGSRSDGRNGPLEALTSSLGTRSILLVLDNFEHVMAAAAQLKELLEATLAVRFLVTSRERLNVAGEQELQVPPLPLPDPSRLPSLAELEKEETIQLFVERARAVREDFVLTTENARAVAEICVRLDGLPLAIELAAARIRLFPPQGVLERLDRRLVLLTGGARNLPARHRTLRATIDWSYNLLEPKEQALFARLGVFAGDFGLGAVRTVCTGEDLPGVEVEALLASLLQKNLVRRVEDLEGLPRYQLLQTLRDYALERLTADGRLEALREKHAAWFVVFVEEARTRLWGPQQAAWLDRLERDHDNLRAALSFATERGDAALTLRLASAVWRFWSIRGHTLEGRRWLEQGLELDHGSAPLELRARALMATAELTLNSFNHERSWACCEESLAIRRRLGDPRAIASILSHMGQLAIKRGEYDQATALFEECLELVIARQDPGQIAGCIISLGEIAMERGQYEQGRAQLEDGLARASDTGQHIWVSFCYVALGYLELRCGNPAAARIHLEAGLELARALDAPGLMGSALEGFGLLAIEDGDCLRATQQIAEALALYQEIAADLNVFQGMLSLAQVAKERRIPTAVVELCEAADAFRESLRGPWLPYDRQRYDRLLRWAQLELTPAAQEKARLEGRARSVEQAVEQGLKMLRT